MPFSDHLPDLHLHKRNIRYSGLNCALGPSKSILYSGDFVITGFVIAGFRYSGVRYSEDFVIAGFVIAGISL